MRRFLTVILLVWLVGFSFSAGEARAVGRASVSANDILKKVKASLGKVKTLRYKYELELNYISEGFRNVSSGDVFLDFTSIDKLIGVRYQFESDRDLKIFNGSEKFDCDKKNKVLKVSSSPVKDAFEIETHLYNSPYTLRVVLPAIISDPAISKKIVADNKSFYVVEFALNKKVLSRLGGFEALEIDRDTIYRLTVDKSSYLPVELRQGNSQNGDFTKASFSELKVDKDAPSQPSWYFSSYLGEYKRVESGKDTVSLIAKGSDAPDWNLRLFNTTENISLSQSKGKVVMLEFWISQCGYCIAAVPKLNAIHKKFKDRTFKLYAINAHDPKEIIDKFLTNNKPEYPTLSPDDSVVNKYGVSGFPAIILIDKKGKVIYSGPFADEKQIESLIEQAIIE